jgi:hypothetical protein
MAARSRAEAHRAEAHRAGSPPTPRNVRAAFERVRDAALFELLDVARRIFNGHLSGTIDLLRLVDPEPAGSRSS